MQTSRRGFVRQLAAATGGLAMGAPVMRAAAQSQFLSAVTLGDFELYYEVHGEGPLVVFAHGAGGTHLSWWQQVPELSRHFQCITFDHRGFGYSRDVDGGPGRAAFVQDLAGLIDHLGLDRVSLVGQSMGGWTTLGYASARRTRFFRRLRSRQCIARCRLRGSSRCPAPGTRSISRSRTCSIASCWNSSSTTCKREVRTCQPDCAV